MSEQEVVIRTLPNGLTIIVEQMPHSASVAYEMHIRGGLMHDAPDTQGSSLILAELLHRGAGELGSREISGAFDDIGASHHESAGLERFVLSGRVVADSLERSLGLSCLIARNPRLDESELPSIKSLLRQDIRSLNDDPARLALEALNKRYFPPPFDRSQYGTLKGVEATTKEVVQSQWEQAFGPTNAILSFAGKVSPDDAYTSAESILGDWQGGGLPRPTFGILPTPASHHVPFDSAQEQIVLALPMPTIRDDSYYAARLVNGLLSAGMFGRLFVEVRDKRGLCYSVHSSYTASDLYGAMIIFAGTTPERAHETLRVIREQLQSLPGTVTDEELDRVKTTILSALVIREESPGARAGTNASDFWHLGRVRSFAEVREHLQSITPADIDAFLERNPLVVHTTLTLGTRSLAA